MGSGRRLDLAQQLAGAATASSGSGEPFGSLSSVRCSGLLASSLSREPFGSPAKSRVTVWSMDSRAGAATEADEAEADLKAISDMLTHADTRTTLRYIRRSEKRIAAAAEARVKSRGETK
jgi:hypothetical protein